MVCALYICSPRLILKNSHATNESYTDMVEELSEANIEHISSQNGVQNEEKVKLCCKPSYQIRKLRNKGAIIILVVLQH